MDDRTTEQKERDRKRLVKINDLFVGKTVEGIEVGGVNAWTVRFTDGSHVKLWAEDAVHTAFGSIPGIMLDQEIKSGSFLGD